MLQNFFLRHLDYNQQARRFFMTVVALGFVIDGVYAVVFNLYLLRLGYETEIIGQINAAGLLTFALIGLPAGFSGSRWSSDRMLRFGLGSILIGTALIPMVEFVTIAWQEIGFMLSYCFVLGGFSLYFVNASPFLMAVIKEEQQNNAFALQTALLALAAFIGSLIGGNLPPIIARFTEFGLDDPQPYRFTLILASIAILVAFVVIMRLVPPPVDNEENSRETDSKPQNTEAKVSIDRAMLMLIAVMSLVRFLQVSGMATLSVFFNVYMDSQLAVSPAFIGTTAAIARIIAVPAVMLTPQLIKRSNTGMIAMLASGLTAICLLPLALIPDELAAAGGYISAIAASNMRYAAFIVYIMVLVPKRHQPIMAGAGEASAGLSFAIMAFGGGYIASIFSFRELFLVGTALSGLGTVVFWLHLRHVKARSA